MTTVKFAPVASLNIGDVVASASGSRHTITEMQAVSVKRRPVLRIMFTDFAGYSHFGFYRADEEMLVEK